MFGGMTHGDTQLSLLPADSSQIPHGQAGQTEHLCLPVPPGRQQEPAHPGAHTGMLPSWQCEGAWWTQWHLAWAASSAHEFTHRWGCKSSSLMKSCLLLSARSRPLQAEAGHKITVYQVKPLNRIFYIVSLFSHFSVPLFAFWSEVAFPTEANEGRYYL